MRGENILVILFSDDDFVISLEELGAYLLDCVGVEALYSMREKGELEENITYMFRAMLVLHQHRFDMYSKQRKEKMGEENQTYLDSDYFKLQTMYFVNNVGECDVRDRTKAYLIVDFNNSTCRMG